MPWYDATTNENHVAQTVLCAVCGFSSPNWSKAADLLRQEVATGVPLAQRGADLGLGGYFSAASTLETVCNSS